MPQRQDYLTDEDYYMALDEYFETEWFMTETVRSGLVEHGRELARVGSE